MENCTITRGVSMHKKNHKGGINKIYIFPFTEYSRGDIIFDGQTITAFPYVTIYEYDVHGASFRENVKSSEAGNSFTQDLSFDVVGIEENREFHRLVQKDHSVIFEDRQGNIRIMGIWNGCQAKLSSTTGARLGDKNGYSITMSGEEDNQAYWVDGFEQMFDIVIPFPIPSVIYMDPSGIAPVANSYDLPNLEEYNITLVPEQDDVDWLTMNTSSTTNKVSFVAEANNIDKVAEKITGLNLLPAAGNYIYDMDVVTATFLDDDGEVAYTSKVNENHDQTGKSDAEVSLDRMEARYDNLESLAVIVTWYGDTADDTMTIEPRLDLATGDPIFSTTWEIGSYNRSNTQDTTLKANGKANVGGSPGDVGLIDFVEECNARGIKVMLYPFLQMDTPGQEWRGQIAFNSDSGLNTWFTSYSAFIRHYSQLFAASSVTLDKFMIGTELVTFTRYQDAAGAHIGVSKLVQLAADVRGDFGAGDAVEVSYGANWDEYHSHDGVYSMDPLWTSPNIDSIGVDNYFPATDFQTASTVTYNDVVEGYEKGEGWDHYYSVYNDPTTKVDYDVAGGEFAWKNVFGWWDRDHTGLSNGPELLTSSDMSSVAYPWNYGAWSGITPTTDGNIATLTLDLDYPTNSPRIEQTFATVIGTEYTVNVLGDSNGNAMQVLVVEDGTFTLIADTTATTSGYENIVFTFTATTVSSVIQIIVQGLTGDTAFLDSVSVKEMNITAPTGWTARMKPLFFAEYGFASVTGTTNQPNVFAPELPRMSNGNIDNDIQRRSIRAFNDYWDTKTQGVTGFAEDRYLWAADLRPFPQFPFGNIWDDSAAWQAGHWVTGKLEGERSLIARFELNGKITDVRIIQRNN